MPPRRQRQPQQRALPLPRPRPLLLLLALATTAPWTARAFLSPRLPAASPKPHHLALPVRPAPSSLPLPLPLRRSSPPAPGQRRRRVVVGNGGGAGDGGEQQQQQQQLTNPLDELERQLKGQEPPTVYVQQTPQGKMRIPLPPGPNKTLILFSVVTALTLGLLGVVVGNFVGVPPLQTLSLLPGGFASGVLLALPLFAVDFLLQGFQEDTASEVYSLSIFGTKTPLPTVLALAAAITLATGIGEEVLFRGLIQEGLSGVLGGIGGLVAASLAFGLSHKMGPADITFITAAGAYMGFAQLILHDLTVPIILHATYDFLILVSAYARAKIRIGPQD